MEKEVGIESKVIGGRSKGAIELEPEEESHKSHYVIQLPPMISTYRDSALSRSQCVSVSDSYISYHSRTSALTLVSPSDSNQNAATVLALIRY